MPLVVPTLAEVFGDRIRRAKARIDLIRPGALEAYQAIPKDAGPEPFEALAERFPIRPRGFSMTAGNERVRAAYRKLAKGMDKAEWQIRFGHIDLGYEDPERLSFGCAALDFISNGGAPRGGIVQLKGPESRGKTFAALKLAAYTIAAGGTVFWLAAERFNATWARKLGVPIVYAAKDLVDMDADERAAAEAYNEANRAAAERFAIIVGKKGNEVLQKAVEAVETNAFDAVIVDSIAVLRKEAHLKKDVGDETMAGEAKLINDFCTRLESGFNFCEDQRGRAVEDGGEVGVGARTAVVVINQLRDQGIGSFIARRPDAPGGWGLKYAKSIDLEFNSYEDVTSEVNGVPATVARRVQVECTKNKVGPPGRKALVEMLLLDQPGGVHAGNYNPVVDLCGAAFKDKTVAGLAEMAGILTRPTTQTYALGELKFRGRAAMEKYLFENPHVVAAVLVDVREWIHAGCPAREVAT